MSHINVSEVLSSLSLAKEAYEALPDMRRQIDDLQAALASKDRLLDTTHTELAQMIASKANVEAKLKEVESERDAYGFRAIDAEEKLEKVFGVVRPATPAPSPQPVTATPEPVTETVASSAQSPYPSGPNTEAREPVGPTSTTTGMTASIDDTKGQSVTPLASSTETSPVQSQGTTVSSSTVTPMDASSPTSYQRDQGDEDHVVVDKPYLGHPSWEKPHDMSWNEWETKGGTVPGWMKHNG